MSKRRKQSPFRGGSSSIFGYTLELLTVADLNARCSSTGGFAYLNPAPFTADDAFVKTSLGWRTVQVKAAQVSVSGAGLYLNGLSRKHITSDILALVAFDQLSVRYVGLTSDLPPELPQGVNQLCRCSSFTAAAAPKKSSVASTIALSAINSAIGAANSSTCLSLAPHGSPAANSGKETANDNESLSFPPQPKVDQGK